MKSLFVHYYLYAFIRPGKTFDQLLADPKRLRYGLYYVSIPAFLYIWVYIFLTIGEGAPSTFAPWLNIPKEEYYFYNRFLTAPSFFMSWMLAAGVIQLLSRLFNGKGSFEDTLSVLGLCIGIAMWGTMLHDVVMSFLGAIHVIDAKEHEIAMNTPTIWRAIIWACISIYLVWFLVLFGKAVATVQKLNNRHAILLGVSGFIAFQVVFLIFNR